MPKMSKSGAKLMQLSAPGGCSVCNTPYIPGVRAIFVLRDACTARVEYEQLRQPCYAANIQVSLCSIYFRVRLIHQMQLLIYKLWYIKYN